MVKKLHNKSHKRNLDPGPFGWNLDERVRIAISLSKKSELGILPIELGTQSRVDSTRVRQHEVATFWPSGVTEMSDQAQAVAKNSFTANASCGLPNIHAHHVLSFMLGAAMAG